MSASHTPQAQDEPNDAAADARPQAPGGGSSASPSNRLDLATVRRRPAAKSGRELWRNLEELADSSEFEELVHREFPRQAAAWPDGVDRRRFLQLMGASFALGGLTACTTQPPEAIVPYVEQPEQIIPGRPLYFASAHTLGGYARGVLVESHLGRPTKIEGNPEHPASLGATDLFAQAAILEMYDPERSQTLRQLGRIRSWNTFVSDTRGALTALAGLGEARLRILTGTVTSPTLAGAIRRLLGELPAARWHQYEAAAPHGARAGARLAFGEAVATRYDLSRARVILSLDADFLTSGPAAVRYARDFMAGRRVRQGDTSMNRLYAVESTPGSTGTLADHRRRARPSEIEAMAVALAARLGVEGVDSGPALDADTAAWLDIVARDLAEHPGASLVVPGDCASAELHALVHGINAALGNVGTTVLVSDPPEAEPVDQLTSIHELVDDMNAGAVDILLVIGGNPVYDAPADLGFAQAMLNVQRRIRLGLYEDETSEYCDWHVPMAHDLESWGDARAFDGTATLIQPLIEPLYGGKAAVELLSALTQDGQVAARDQLRSQWQELDDATWRKALHDGVVPGTELAPRVAPAPGAVRRAAETVRDRAASDGLELALRPDPTVWDGRWANNGWLQECPKPLTLLTWDNAALMSPAEAERLGVETGEMVVLQRGSSMVEAPVWTLPGHADGTVTLHLGYGRRTTGRVGTGTGFDAYPLRTTDAPWGGGGLTVTPTGRSYPLASTQLHANIEQESQEAEDRHLVRVGTLERFKRDPEFAPHMTHAGLDGPTLYPLWEYDGYAWGLAVDLSACTGCNACVVACHAENNIPVVGKEQVALGREMHWIRIDRYFQGDLDDPAVHHQPVMCMHCEQAPCEVVCPVAATVHSDEGLNDMVYNRCVGTRYCSNNCPYKVRRFNFLEYNDTDEPVLDLMRNPDVTVRVRGVMEKCTYCVQRINHARIDAKREERKIRDGEILTACQQVCPTEAIVFGDINDPESRVARWKADPLNYGILEDLNTRPRTTYLAKLRNPNPELAAAEPEPAGHDTPAHDGTAHQGEEH